MATTTLAQLVRFFSLFDPSTYGIFLAIFFVPLIAFLIMSGTPFFKSILTAAGFTVAAVAAYCFLAFLP